MSELELKAGEQYNSWWRILIPNTQEESVSSELVNPLQCSDFGLIVVILFLFSFLFFFWLLMGRILYLRKKIQSDLIRSYFSQVISFIFQLVPTQPYFIKSEPSFLLIHQDPKSAASKGWRHQRWACLQEPFQILFIKNEIQEYVFKSSVETVMLVFATITIIFFSFLSIMSSSDMMMMVKKS